MRVTRQMSEQKPPTQRDSWRIACYSQKKQRRANNSRPREIEMPGMLFRQPETCITLYGVSSGAQIHRAHPAQAKSKAKNNCRRRCFFSGSPPNARGADDVYRKSSSSSVVHMCHIVICAYVSGSGCAT